MDKSSFTLGQADLLSLPMNCCGRHVNDEIGFKRLPFYHYLTAKQADLRR